MDLNTARDKVLRENIAQTVYKYLRDIHNNRQEYADRWIWELLQNARDTAKDDGATVEAARTDHLFSFRHDGAPFVDDEVAHLVYHGSSKDDRASSAEPIGRFGSGFLTTHILAGTITIRGLLKDGDNLLGFHFPLNREGASADELIAAMDGSWKAFNDSLTTPSESSFTTEYTYPLTPDTAPFATRGIASLERLAPYTLAFNPSLREIRITHDDKQRRVWVLDGGRTELAPGLTLTTIRTADGTSKDNVVAVAAKNGIAVAIMTERIDGKPSITPPQNCPRLFVAFPLFGTDEFCFPAVINCEHFAVREKRDGIYLGADKTTDIIENKERIATACELFVQLLRAAAEQGWTGLHHLAQLPARETYNWLDQGWYAQLLKHAIIEPTRDASIIDTHDGTRLSAKHARIPLAKNGYSVEELWDLTAHLDSISGALPIRVDATAWAQTLEHWAALLTKNAEELPEAWTIDTLARHIAGLQTLERLKSELNGADPLAWLSHCFALIARAQRTKLFDDLRLLPDQNGTFRGRKDLREDTGIHEELKDIAATLGLPGRTELLNNSVDRSHVPELGKKTEQELIAQLLQSIREKPESKATTPAYRAANIALFTWLLTNNQRDKLEGYPCFTQQEGDEHSILQLTRKKEPDAIPLAPPPLWPDDARLFIDLFPERHTVAQAYYDAQPTMEYWTALAHDRYIRTDPVFTTTARENELLSVEPLPDADGQKHRIAADVTASAIAFLGTKNVGVIDRARGSQLKARQLLHFLADYVAKNYTVTQGPAQCECATTHNYYQAAWLKPLQERTWVPIGDKKHDKATAETLATLLHEEPAFLRELAVGPAATIMRALGISASDLLLRIGTKTEEERVQFVASALDLNEALGNDPAKLHAIVKALKDDPDVLGDIQKAAAKRNAVRRNQGVGKTVEDKLKELLQATGLTVTRKHIGHDFEIEHDVVDPDAPDTELGWEIGTPHRSFLLEVKASTEYHFRMTPKQAETAVTEGPRFVVCMVQLPTASNITPDDILAGARFVPGIGTHIDPVWQEFNTLEDLKATVGQDTTTIELEFEGGTTRFKVSKTLWEQGLSFDNAIRLFQGLPPK